MGKPIKGKVWKFGDSMNTDDMYPSVALSMSIKDASAYAFSSSRPGWTSEVGRGDIVLAGRDFGVGSSRPVPLLFRQLGISAVLAESITSLFFRNCVNYGLRVLAIEGLHAAFEEGQIAEVDIENGLVRNLDTDMEFAGARYPPMLLALIESGGVLNRLRSGGYLAELSK